MSSPRSDGSARRRAAENSRPGSNTSQEAWDGAGSSNQGYEDDIDDLPTAMESEMYVDGTVHVLQQPKRPAQVDNEGCWDKFKRGVRSLWATRQSEDTKHDPELHVKTTLRELILYIIFLVILVVLTFGMTSSTMFYYTSVMSGLFLDTIIPTTTNSFRTLTNKADFFKFMHGPLMDGLYWETWYNNNTLPADDQGYIFYENKMLGVPRLRMLKVKDDSCTVASELQGEIPKCYAVYSKSREDRATFGNTNNSAFHYRTSDQLGGSSHWGLISTYGGGGFVQELARNRSESEKIIQQLKNFLWVDRGTRVVFIDFTVYNANINLFCVVRLLAEMPATGGIIPSWSFRTVKLLRYVNTGDYFVMACECIFILFIIYYVVEEALEIKKNKLQYFKSFWNLLDIMVIVISVVCICFNFYRTIAVNDKLSQLLEMPNTFSDFEFLSYWQMAFNNAVAVTVFLAWIKFFKYISFNKTMTQLSSTLGRCAKDIAGFAMMFFIVFFAFAQLGNLMFGSLVRDFRTFGDASFTLFRIILGDFNYYELESANRVLGPAYFFLYVFFVFLVLLNMFLAIINDTYSEVKSDLATQKNEFEMGDYFKKGYNKMMDKLNFKRDKIIDIQKALTTADINDDKIVDFDEWRQQLKMRGYAEGEIEAIFSKYDTDGDRQLDEGEQLRMREDLEGQRQTLSKELEEMDHDKYSPDIETDNMGGAAVGPAGSRAGVAAGGATQDEFQVLTRRVDRMEHSIGSIVVKIDAVLLKLEAMELNKMKRREAMTKILSSISESEESEEAKRERMERLVRDELERWDANSVSPIGAGQVSPDPQM